MSKFDKASRNPSIFQKKNFCLCALTEFGSLEFRLRIRVIAIGWKKCDKKHEFSYNASVIFKVKTSKLEDILYLFIYDE